MRFITSPSIRQFSCLAHNNPLKFKQLGILSTSSNSTWKSSISHNKSHLKPDQSVEETKEQKLFDKNQDFLDRMEHDPSFNDWKKPNDEKLKKIGDDARIEQNRPDDGVY